ncbi:MAG: hypothetical protein ACREHF_12070 [Rhizomicrobium sp.]
MHETRSAEGTTRRPQDLAKSAGIYRTVELPGARFIGFEDANAELAANPKLPSSLYVRGLAKLKSGDTAGGNADIAASWAMDAKVADEYAGYGVAP